jgi:UDP-N-acetylglucosamine:LPS N-acetylglucosamine transferase
MKTGYDDAMKHHPKRYKNGDLKLVPFCIRNEAYDFDIGKMENRKKLGIPEDKFVITLAEGGYGIGKMEDICKILLEKDLPVVLIPICGKNKELYDKLSTLKNGKNAEIRPLAFTPNVFGYIASSDLFCGKSGNMIAEPTFFGVPSIITKHSTNIERHIGDYYEKYLKCALTILDLNKIIAKIEEFINDKTKLTPYIENALKAHDKYGAEKSADYVYELLKRKYPEL